MEHFNSWYEKNKPKQNKYSVHILWDILYLQAWAVLRKYIDIIVVYPGLIIRHVAPQGAALSRFTSPGGQLPQQTMYNSSEFMRLVHNTLQYSGDPIWYNMAIFF